MRKFLGKVGGRKFIVTILSLVAMVVNGVTGAEIPDSTVMTIGAIVSTYLLGQGYADGKSGGATSTSTDTP